MLLHFLRGIKGCLQQTLIICLVEWVSHYFFAILWYKNVANLLIILWQQNVFCKIDLEVFSSLWIGLDLLWLILFWDKLFSSFEERSLTLCNVRHFLSFLLKFIAANVSSDIDII